MTTSRPRLPDGALRELIQRHLDAHPGRDFSPGELARVLDRSRGAIANACHRLVQHGQARQSTTTPRRYTSARQPSTVDKAAVPNNTSRLSERTEPPNSRPHRTLSSS
jgi:hypothetical protein